VDELAGDAFLDDCDGRGQGPVSQHYGHLVGGLGGEASGDLAETGTDRLDDRRRGNDLAIDQDGEALGHILPSDFTENARSLRVKPETNDPPFGLLVDLGVDLGEMIAS
jgi:hypothetical protein